jgi:hypothetical protein
MAFYKAKFTDKHHSVGGIISTLLGLIAFAMLAFCVKSSFSLEGNGGQMLGAIGVAALFVSIGGCIMGLLSFKETDKYYIFSKIGSMLCGILVVLMFGIFLIGF